MSNGMKKTPLHSRSAPVRVVEEELKKLRIQAAPFEARGQYDTAHHKMIRRLELELALLEARPVIVKSDEEE